MKKLLKVIAASLSVIIFYIVAAGVRFTANSFNSTLEGSLGIAVLTALMILYALLVFYGYTVTVFALSERKYLKALLFTASMAVGGITANAFLNGFLGTKTSIVPIAVFLAASYLIPLSLTFIMKNRAVLFTVSCIAFVFLNIILLNNLSPDSASALGTVFPNLRVDSELGDNNGVLSYILYVILFAAEYLIMRKCYKKLRG